MEGFIKKLLREAINGRLKISLNNLPDTLCVPTFNINELR
jgi:hypothetical protein